MKKSNSKHELTHEQISADVEAFLNRGGKIEKIPKGVTGGQSIKYGRSIETRDSRSK